MYLGVDGGGTKTAFVLIDQHGNVLAEHQEPTCYHIQVGIDGTEKVIHEGILKTLAKAKKEVKDLTFAFLGLPAFGEDSKVDKIVDLIPSGILPKNLYRCDNDMVNGWAAASGGMDGINIVAGTGSIAYGVRKNKGARCGGWGELFSDEGSAYWIGIKCLNRFSQMADGRLPKGPLYKIVKQELDIDIDLDITALVLTQWQGERSKIAALSKLVSIAAEQGDTLAREIMQDAGYELARIVNSTKETLKFQEDEPVKVSYSGGVFCSKALILEPFTEALQQYSCHYVVSAPVYTPVIGAALYACTLSGNRMQSQALQKLKN
ncbi:BadF/BadG/BcrA/BcrD ATPase family protein [uncultured Paraglaciecola sp.]|uniref:N-acetylglucosamine kinase n=1 Tax=uncultured Paraglaciecola sp. TaxID=1765024 RepID=UPI0030DB6331|tara:strand:+ start:192387 stop:193346 length:960 start_codon:yes stop_codon:yes gene_type:complete